MFVEIIILKLLMFATPIPMPIPIGIGRPSMTPNEELDILLINAQMAVPMTIGMVDLPAAGRRASLALVD